MTFPSFCLCIAAIVFLTDAKSMTQKLLNLDVHTKNLQNLHVQFQKLTKAKGYLLTETHFEMKTKTICTLSGCSSSVEVVKGSQRNCPGNWKKFRGNCYMLLSKKQNQESGKIACKLLNGNLADITSESENTWLHKTFNGLKDTAWIDATDRAKEGEWRWSSTGKLLKFTAWLKGEPNNSNGKEHCAVAYTTGGKCAWYDVSCSISRQTLCKKKA